VSQKAKTVGLPVLNTCLELNKVLSGLYKAISNGNGLLGCGWVLDCAGKASTTAFNRQSKKRRRMVNIE
jgi:hypothetical protein